MPEIRNWMALAVSIIIPPYQRTNLEGETRIPFLFGEPVPIKKPDGLSLYDDIHADSHIDPVSPQIKLV